ncbi:ABC transporter related protein [Desulfonatronospira thiodismutans ASO3-1]|uniref:ABC transporter related protein n=1 Tax=Desulfonatronospira thiodismutans ASO3-1 TaxID=555779 RepID=D6SLC9_9BACT|nr:MULTISPECIES: ATP-binding cassette domain-containing protein [Desulfonatronospira]EFI35490.1 ABC transporter related protein [Desulfonatronospira thiodismutans ASO3-1]RQD77609.1 MAG: ATP-binding cassette domain-containing protein [Desulfonatronospira sp. MSAO_Bac3]
MHVQCQIKASLKSGKENFSLEADFDTSSSSIVLFGPSGAGKSLTLMALAGLQTPDSGKIVLDGRTLYDSAKKINIPARKRKVGLLFQDYALFPHLTVMDNVGFGLKRSFRPLKVQQKNKIYQYIQMFGLENHTDKKPHELSGGQRQRAALARALVSNPDLLLLDEPFSALDQPLRIKMRSELGNILEKFNMPMIMVSHDHQDVEAFGETLVSFGHGRVLDVLDYQSRRRQGQDVMDILTPLYQTASI